MRDRRRPLPPPARAGAAAAAHRRRRTSTAGSTTLAELPRERADPAPAGRAGARPSAATWSPTRPAPDVIHGDLHYENVLAGDREPWLVIDPKPMSRRPALRAGADAVEPLGRARRGDVRDGVRRRFHTIVDAAGLDEDRARDWVVVRMVPTRTGRSRTPTDDRPLDAEERDWITSASRSRRPSRTEPDRRDEGVEVSASRGPQSVGVAPSRQRARSSRATVSIRQVPAGLSHAGRAHLDARQAVRRLPVERSRPPARAAPHATVRCRPSRSQRAPRPTGRRVRGRPARSGATEPAAGTRAEEMAVIAVVGRLSSTSPRDGVRRGGSRRLTWPRVLSRPDHGDRRRHRGELLGPASGPAPVGVYPGRAHSCSGGPVRASS